MWYGVGIDLGTVFTSAAVRGPAGATMVSLTDDLIVASVATVAPGGSLLTGQAAVAADLDPERVARGFKLRLGEPTPLILGGSSFSPAALMAAQLRDVLAAVTEAQGDPPGSIVLTYPAVWGQYRREQFTEVPKLAGVRDYQLITEPEAAVAQYSRERPFGDGEVVAVVDLGGGTFDTTVLRMRAGRAEILGTPEGIGHLDGIDFDETLFAHVDDRLDGALSALDDADPRSARALAETRAIIVRAKEDLSIEPDVRLGVPLPDGRREVAITRVEFNDMIRPSIQLTIDAFRRTIGSAELRAEDLSGILLAGGYAHIPLVSQIVTQTFAKSARVIPHPQFTVALGAATVAGRPVAADQRAGTTGLPAPPASFPRSTPSAGFPPLPHHVEPSQPRRAPVRRKWLVPAIAAAGVAVLAAVASVLLINHGDIAQPVGQASEQAAPTSRISSVQPTSPPAERSGLPTLHFYDGGAVSPWVAIVASADNWDGTEIGPNGGSQKPINATADGDGLRVRWQGPQAQVYLQSSVGPQNLASYVDADGALVFDIVVHLAPTAPATIGVHCEYPCGANIPITELLQGIAQNQQTPVKIPLACFTSAGLDAEKVNTPFLLAAGESFDATFADVRWEADAAGDPDATPCAELR